MSKKKAIVVTAPKEDYSVNSQHAMKLFLAGGITNCPDWQSEVIKGLQDIEGLVIYNPRRKNFPINNPGESQKQITWEFRKLQECKYISFWFAQGSLNPIVLYELGMWGNYMYWY
jgi:hypothetical protein